MPELTRLKKHQTMIHIDVSATSTPSWARIGRSTVLDLVMNASTETSDFIEDEQPTTDLKNYNPQIAEELQANKGDPAFDFLYKMFKERPTGEEVKKSVLLTFAGNIGTDQAPEFDAWLTESTITIDHFDAVAEKIYFNIAMNDITDGTVTVSDGVPSFTPASSNP